MKEARIKADDYISQLDVMLGRLGREIETRLASLEKPSDIQNLDAYIHEINSFYYRSFHERFFPLYRQNIQEEIKHKLHLSLQEDALKQGILSSIKRYAQLYNQIKKLSQTMDTTRENANQQMLTLNREQDRRSIELFCGLKQWHEHLQALEVRCRRLAEILEDRELRVRLERDPAQLAVLQMLDSLDLQQPLAAAGVNSVLSYLVYCQSLVAQLQKEKNFSAGSLNIIREIQAGPMDAAGEKLPAVLQRYCQSYLVERINTYLQPLEFCGPSGDQQFYQKNLRLLAQFLENAQVILERSQHYVLNGHQALLTQAFYGLQVPADLMVRMKQGLNQTLDTLARLNEQFSPPFEPDFNYFGQQSHMVLEQTRRWMEEAVASEAVNRIGPLSSSLHLANFELQYLLRWLDFLKQEAGQRSELLTALLTVVNTLDGFLNLLGSMRADLERLLAPRNISRLWKGYTIRVKRLALEKGHPFPPQYLHLLEDPRVEKQSGPTEDNIILLEEGDLFIIRVDDEQDEEIPHLVISKKE